MEQYVYCLQSLSRKYIYVGMTNNPGRRIVEHSIGKEKTTRSYRPFKVILIEEYKTRETASRREKYLKTGCGKEYLKKLIKK